MKCRVCGYDLDPSREYCDMCGTTAVASDLPVATKEASVASPKEPQAASLEYVPEPPAQATAPASASAPIHGAAITMPPQSKPLEEIPPAPPLYSVAPPVEPIEKENSSPESESEFSWNVYSFPKPKLPGDISMEWPDSNDEDLLGDSFMVPERKIQQAVEKNEPVVMVSKDVSEGFVAVPDRREVAERFVPVPDPKEVAWKTPMEESTKKAENFFTFQKKNEEFQRLLDTEYEKLMNREKGEEYKEKPFTSDFEPVHAPSGHVVQAEGVEAFERMLIDNTKDADFVSADTLPINLEKVQEEVRAQEAARMQYNEEAYRIQREIIEKAEQEAREAILSAEMRKTPELPIAQVEIVQKIRSQNRERIDAMSKAREIYFQSDGIDDVDLPSAAATLVHPVQTVSADNMPVFEPLKNEPEGVLFEAQPSQTQENPDTEALFESEAFLPLMEATEKKKIKKQKKMHWFLKFLLILILIPLILETAVVGLRTFAPDYAFTETASNMEQNVIAQVLEWGNTAKQFVIDQLERMGLNVKTGEAENLDLPDTEPKLDLGSLVSQYNINIKSITESPSLGYESTGEYEVEGLDKMMNVEDLELKKAVYACLISYNSKWVDYVNTGEDKSCLDLLKADGAAYRSALNFSKIGKIKEEFESLMLGEIRHSGSEYYVFVREHIAVTEEGKTSLSAYSWLYRLEDVAGDMKILDYTAFKN